MTRYIDVTPTWTGILPSIRAVIENATTDEAKEAMWAELARMAQAADKWNASNRRTAK